MILYMHVLGRFIPPQIQVYSYVLGRADSYSQLKLIHLCKFYLVSVHGTIHHEAYALVYSFIWEYIANYSLLKQTVRGKCFDKCITKPGTSLSGGESSCVSRCVDRYIEATGIISRALFSSQRWGLTPNAEDWPLKEQALSRIYMEKSRNNLICIASACRLLGFLFNWKYLLWICVTWCFRWWFFFFLWNNPALLG